MSTIKGPNGQRTKFLIRLCCIVAFAFIFMVFFLRDHAFWLDDIYQLAHSGNGQSFYQVINNIAQKDEHPPLWACIVKLWVQISPYGTANLLLLPEFFVAAGIFFVGLAGRRLWNERVGLFAAFMAATSFALITEAALSFRPYSLLFFAASFLAYKYVEREQDLDLANTLGFTFAMLLLGCSHYFGVFVAFSFALTDLFRFVSGWKQNPRGERWRTFLLRFLPYGICFVVMAPWVLYVQFAHVREALEGFWATTPHLEEWNDVFGFLTSFSPVLLALFLFSCVAIVLLCKNGPAKPSNIAVAFVFVTVAVNAGVFLYSICPLWKTSAWVNRYFTCLLPYLFLVCGFGVNYLSLTLQSIHSDAQQVNAAKVLPSALLYTLAIFMFMNCIDSLVPYPRTTIEPFEDVADGLMEQEDILDPDTLVYVTTINNKDGWRYYLSHKGQRSIEGINLVDGLTIMYFKYIDFTKYHTIYCFKVHGTPNVDFEAFEAKLAETHDRVRMDLPGEVYRYTLVDEEPEAAQ